MLKWLLVLLLELQLELQWHQRFDNDVHCSQAYIDMTIRIRPPEYRFHHDDTCLGCMHCLLELQLVLEWGHQWEFQLDRLCYIDFR